jgi:hypothetical protein
VIHVPAHSRLAFSIDHAPHVGGAWFSYAARHADLVLSSAASQPFTPAGRCDVAERHADLKSRPSARDRASESLTFTGGMQLIDCASY